MMQYFNSDCVLLSRTGLNFLKQRIMGRTKRNWLLFYNKMLSFFLLLLGFSACSDEDKDEEILLMYGPPPVNFSVKTQVVNENDKPIEGIQVDIKTDDEQGFIIKSGLTDSKGWYETKINNPHINIVFTDVDGEKNGTYEKDSVQTNLYNINGDRTYQHKMKLKVKK